MGQYIVHCSGENVELGLAELQALLPECTVTPIEHTVYSMQHNDEAAVKEVGKKLAYVRYIAEIKHVCPTILYEEHVKKIKPESAPEPIWVTVEKTPNATKKPSSFFIKNYTTTLENPGADQSKYKTHWHIVVTAKKTYICLNPTIADTTYLKRKPTQRPYVHPSTIQPRLAKALINISGIERGILWDPFCGIGGILLEAAMMGIYVKGTDIDEEMVSTAKKMLEHYKIKAYQLSLADASTTKETCDVVVTDVPYGKNTKDISPDLYEKFLENIKTCTKIAVIVFPDFVDMKTLLEKTKWKVSAHCKHYVHKSLSKHIYVLYQ